MEYKRLLPHALVPQGVPGNVREVARTLRHLSDANRLLDPPKEGIPLAEEVSEVSNGSVIQYSRHGV